MLLREQAGNAAWFVYHPWEERRESSQFFVGSRAKVGAAFEYLGGETAVIIDMFALRDQVFRSLGVEPEAA